MRKLILGISILCLALSGLITFKALNLPEKKYRSASLQASIKTHKTSQDISETVFKPNKEQDRESSVKQVLQNTNPQLGSPPEPDNNTSQNILEVGKTEKSLDQVLFSVNFNPGAFVIKDTTKKLIEKSARAIISTNSNYR